MNLFIIHNLQKGQKSLSSRAARMTKYRRKTANAKERDRMKQVVIMMMMMMMMVVVIMMMMICCSYLFVYLF